MISVIVCTYNRQEYLPDCLKHLANQSAENKDYEVLIIDNKSTDNTAKISREFIQNYPKMHVHYFLEASQGLTHARNRGIIEAKGEILSFIDDDAFVDQNYINEIRSYFDQNKNINAIGGKIMPVYEGKEPKWMSNYLLTLVAALDMGNAPKKFKGAKFPIGANMAFRASIFMKYGNFNPELGRRGSNLEGGEEKDLFFRLKENNEEFHYVPSVYVQHIIPEKRLEIPYIRKLGIGVGSSERKRLLNSGSGKWLKKLVSELIKIIATLALFVVYSVQLRSQAAIMLVKFRIWVIKGLIQKPNINAT